VMDQDLKQNLSRSLLFIRLSVFLVMLMWTLDKFINVDHAKIVYEKFYYLSGFGNTVMYVFGGIELVFLLMFVVGYKKRYSYGLIFVLHLISTLSSFKQYLDPWKSLLFFAAWPMLAACYALYVLRDYDTKCSLRSYEN